MSIETTPLFIAIFTDEDVTSLLAPALRRRGYTAQSAIEAGLLGYSDEILLTYATQHHMALLTYNADDFTTLAESWYFAGREHTGIILAPQFNRRQFGELLRQVLRLLNSLTADELQNQVVFLQQFSNL